jgi:hydroxypyruvate reductase
MLKYQDYRQHTEELFRAALEAADPGSALKRYFRRDGNRLYIDSSEIDIGSGRVFLVSVGKASLPMAEAAYQILGERLYAAGVISKRGGREPEGSPLAAHPRAQLMAGSHPVSDEDSVRATAEIVRLMSQTAADDLVLCLISGGASALLTQPAVSLSDWRLLVNALLASGCTINELNTVRRQLDRVKGGGLARLASPARCVSLILSDVVGNALEAIGSGPTYTIAESPEQALAVLEQYDIARSMDQAAYRRISEALLHERDDRTRNMPPMSEHFIVGDVKQAAKAALARAESLGFDAKIVTVTLEGEARKVGRNTAEIAKKTPPGRCLIFGGETTVTLRGDGLGGRNLETALAAAISLADWSRIAIASLATDGEDGPTPAAGAVVSGWTAPVAAREGLPPQDYLEQNDSYSFFEKLDGRTRALRTSNECYPPCLVVTGSTGTNVNDLIFILAYE